MHLEPTAEQNSYQLEVAAFASSIVAPRAAEIDESAAFPRDIVAAAARFGLMGVTIPVEWGGAGRDYVSYTLAIEALSQDRLWIRAHPEDFVQVTGVADVHRAQLISYLRTTGLRGGLLINFSERMLKDGLKRVVL